jgi:hypothetical protein
VRGIGINHGLTDASTFARKRAMSTSERPDSGSQGTLQKRRSPEAGRLSQSSTDLPLRE